MCVCVGESLSACVCLCVCVCFGKIYERRALNYLNMFGGKKVTTNGVNTFKVPVCACVCVSVCAGVGVGVGVRVGACTSWSRLNILNGKDPVENARISAFIHATGTPTFSF